MDFPFTPEMAYLYLLNVNNEEFKKLDDSVDEYSLLNFTIKENEILMINLTRTK